MSLSRAVKEDLSWWMVRDHLLEGFRFGTPAPDLHLYLDASRSRLGAHLLERVVSGLWAEQEKLLTHQSSRNEGDVLALQSFQEEVTGCRVTAICDNSTVVAYVNKQGGTVSYSLCSLASRLLRWTKSLDIHLDSRYLPGQSNVLADPLSCRDQVIGTEWSLHLQVATALLRAWGSPSRDLFVTRFNTKLPLSCFLVPDPQAVFDDVFRHPWDNLDVCAFPPFPLVGRVVARVRETPNLSMTLAGEGVVRGSSSSADPTTSLTASVGLAVAAAPLRPLPPRHPRAEPSCVATLQHILRKLGFSRGSAIEMSGCVRTSTSCLYRGSGYSSVVGVVKGHCSSQRHCSLNRGFPGSLTS